MVLFNKDDVSKLLKNKRVVIIGDSVYRGMYKDLILALQENRLLTDDELKSKADSVSYLNDSLVYRTAVSNGIDFTEFREYQSADGFHLIKYYFVTKCYYNITEAILTDFEKDQPDVVIMNSCLWDISRYNTQIEADDQRTLKNIDDYLKNMSRLLTRLREILKPTSIFIWCTGLPLSSNLCIGALLHREHAGLRTAIMDVNYLVAQLVVAYGFDVLDLHYYMRSQLKHRTKDGCHWDGWGHRHMTELILTFLADTWGERLPDTAVQMMKDLEKERNAVNLPHLLIDGRPSFVEVKLKKLEEEEDRERMEASADGSEQQSASSDGGASSSSSGAAPDIFLQCTT